MLSAFAEMLRYQLYECNGSRIAIEKEVAYLRSYVDLQRMRRDGHYNISFTADETLTGFKIAPLLLLPFVENAFKHVSHTLAANEIEVKLSYQASKFRMTVYNTRDREIASGTGIGLRNVSRRLELMYNGKHALSVEDKPSWFRIQVDLDVETDYDDATDRSSTTIQQDDRKEKSVVESSITAMADRLGDRSTEQSHSMARVINKANK